MIEINQTVKSRINLKIAKAAAENFLQFHKIGKDVSIAFVSDKKIRELNKKYRHYDTVTDILAFGERNNPKFLGELVIDYAQIKRQAKHFSKSADEELVFILVHGLYHLLGYEDATKKGKEKMDRLTKKFINNIKKAIHCELRNPPFKSPPFRRG